MTGRLSDALAHLQGAITALSNEAYVVDMATGEERPVPALESCIGDDLIQIDRRIGASRPTLIGAIGEAIREAMADVVAAHIILTKISEDRNGEEQEKLPAGRAHPDQLSGAGVGSGDSSVLASLGLKLDIAAARLATAKAKNPKTTADMAAYLQRHREHKQLKAEYRSQLHALTGERTDEIARRLAQ